MKFKVLFILNSVRKNGIKNNYMPTWISNSKPNHNSGMIIFNDIEFLEKEISHICELSPLCSEFWEDIRLNEVLNCMEGTKQVGSAIVLDIIK